MYNPMEPSTGMSGSNTGIGIPPDVKADSEESTAGGSFETGQNQSSIGSYSSSSTRSSHESDSHNRAVCSLSVVQQPGGASESGSDMLSRLPLNPALIVKLDVHNPEGDSVDLENILPFLICHLTLLPALPRSESPSTTPNESSRAASIPLDQVRVPGPDPAPQSPTRPELSSSSSSSGSSDTKSSSASSPTETNYYRALYGNLVSSAFTLSFSQDSNGRPIYGQYFVFPDVSVRFLRGTFRLGISLFRIRGPGQLPSSSSASSSSSSQDILAYTTSQSFEIVSSEDYHAPGQTTMTASVIGQGVRMYSHEVNL
ncbi:Velvet factor [Phaffia rhodozyma]|uniref:Velvet factor n=1 Tax=Phaffia rhodozyma TaxID=264483 RepID=A0A0F7SGU5_PHARH|nr:Velvet factor [Phaffia rhodozyma]